MYHFYSKILIGTRPGPNVNLKKNGAPVLVNLLTNNECNFLHCHNEI
jgi:hypothetical protein